MVDLTRTAKESFEKRMKEMKGEIDLVALHDKYKEMLYIEDTKRIDVLLATVLS